MLNLYRAALELRRADPALGDGPLEWLPADDGVLTFRRSPDLLCVTNLAAAAATLPDHTEVLLSSGPLDPDGRLPSDTAVWLRS
jgi:alpha-glucosidase